MTKAQPNKTSSKLLKNRVAGKKLPNSFKIFSNSMSLFKTNWQVLGGITLTYALLSIVLVQSSISIDSLNDESSSGNFSKATNNFSNLISSFSTGDSLMQFVLFLIVGLAIIWATRRLVAGEQASIKQSYYMAMTPMIPVVILLIIFCIQLLPMLLVSAGLQLAFSGSGSSSVLEGLLWLGIFGLASAWSLFMISRTYIAIYIATLPGMTPLLAMKKAKELVKGRRFSVIRKLLFLPIAIFIILGVILIPTIMIASIIASPLFLLLGPLAVSFSILYLFVLYQEVIK